jgi:asparagine synthase (glutamine-hydrolysing)
MLNAQSHEPFYSTGTFIDESLGVYVGWTALPNSSCSGMPLANERGDAHLIFSGEEYPEPGIVERLRKQGHSLSGESGSHLIHLYEQDSNFVTGLNGVFHGILVDQARRRVMLFNDRYGMRRVCYHDGKDGFYFAAEAKAILAVLPDLRRSDPQRLGEFVAYSCVLENRTLFKGVQVLPGASAWSFRNAELAQKTVYFEPREWEEQTPLAPEPFYRELRDTFSRNLPRYFNGSQPLAMSLTGGMDTRMLMAWRKPAPKSLPCYTYGGPLRECEDVRLARRIANVCQQSHDVLRVGKEFLSRFPHYAERTVYLTEGGADVYRASDLYLSERARKLAPVKIVGTYGSEIIRHAVMFKPMIPPPGLYCPDFLPAVRQAGATYSSLRRQNPTTFAAFRQSPWYHSQILALEQSQLTVRSPYLDNDFVRTVFRSPQASDGDIRLRLIREGDAALGNIPTDRGIGGRHRFPGEALSHAFMEFTFKAEYAYDYGMPQWLSRVDHFLSPLHLDRLFLGRHKLLHFRVWYRDQLADYVRQILLDPRTLNRPFLERKRVEAMVHGHLEGGQNHTSAIHKLLTLELLHRQFLD